MLCQDCVTKESCTKMCEDLKKELKGIEVYQRELLYAPDKLRFMWDKIGLTLADVTPETTWIWDHVLDHLYSLPLDDRHAFVLRRCQGWSTGRTARVLSVSRRTVQRRTRRAEAALHQRIFEKNRPRIVYKPPELKAA